MASNVAVKILNVATAGAKVGGLKRSLPLSVAPGSLATVAGGLILITQRCFLVAIIPAAGTPPGPDGSDVRSERLPDLDAPVG